MNPIPHADTLVDLLTVEEMLLYTAELKLPMSQSFEEKKAVVEGVIEALALGHCRKTRIGRCAWLADCVHG